MLDRLGDALARTRATFSAVFSSFAPGSPLDDAAWGQLEEALIRADVGPRTAAALVGSAREAQVPVQELKGWLAEEVRRRIARFDFALASSAAGVGAGPTVILVVGVNGAGKTTTIGKLASRYKLEGKSVMLGAGDTFRAGAIDQLKVWGERAGVPVVAHQEGGDPAAVCHDTIKSAIAKGIDIVILDTAGRLQAHAALMAELGKIVRVVQKLLPTAPHEVLLVLDGTMGQNALAQARVFKEVTHVTGIALTKLDGTAKGGVVVAIAEELNLPVKLVGCGEKLDDLRDFDPDVFARALFA
ncbi:MAG: signal recognition particle-docking protein FtsY [Myxococcales bacterium]|nr:signal recognition particle-docking protein FtsY [Myxococcales bacterium]